MSLPNYFADASKHLQHELERIRRFFASHKPTAGENREGLVAEFLKQHLPGRFAVSSGLVLSSEGQFSNQADVLITDGVFNAPLFQNQSQPLWLIEAVYALLEVKTLFSPTTFADSLSKCVRFKKLVRRFSDLRHQLIAESLFVLWAFEGPSPEIVKKTMLEQIKDVPRELHPDFVVIPGLLVARGGHYFELSKLGQPGSSHRNQLLQRVGGDVSSILGQGLEVGGVGEHALLVFLIWFSSWLQAAGERGAPLQQYLPEGSVYGKLV